MSIRRTLFRSSMRSRYGSRVTRFRPFRSPRAFRRWIAEATAKKAAEARAARKAA